MRCDAIDRSCVRLSKYWFAFLRRRPMGMWFVCKFWPARDCQSCWTKDRSYSSIQSELPTILLYTKHVPCAHRDTSNVPQIGPLMACLLGSHQKQGGCGIWTILSRFDNRIMNFHSVYCCVAIKMNGNNRCRKVYPFSLQSPRALWSSTTKIATLEVKKDPRTGICRHIQ